MTVGIYYECLRPPPGDFSLVAASDMEDEMVTRGACFSHQPAEDVAASRPNRIHIPF